MIKYTINLSLTLREYPDFYERFQRAADLGFRAVEFSSPFGYDIEKVVQAAKASRVHVVQFNVADGNMAVGERGYASIPAKKEQWRDDILKGLALAVRLGARQINSLGGCAQPGMTREQQIEVLMDNYRWAIPHLEEAKIPLQLEALNTYDNPGYLFARSKDVLDVLKAMNSPWLKFQYDVYHMQRMEGELVNTMKANLAYINHIQIADNPGRHQPGSGEINYAYVMKAIEEMGYDGYVGLEYVSDPNAAGALDWLPKRRRVQSTAADLKL